VNILEIIIFGILYLYSGILLYLSYISKKNHDLHAFYNNLANFIILVTSLSINLYITTFTHLTIIKLIVFPFDIFIIIFIGIFYPLFFLTIYREKSSLNSKRKVLNSKRNMNQLPLKYEIYRKLSHLVVLGIVFFYFTLGFLVNNIFVHLLEFYPPIVSDLFYSIYNIEGNKMIFTQYLVVFLVIISFLGLSTADVIRILKPDKFPLKPINVILREKEKHYRVGPHISMAIGCLSIIIIYGIFQPIGPLIICTSMTMTVFGDISANIIGRIFGRIKIRKTEKTYEGLLSGILTSFVSGLICLMVLNQTVPIVPLKIFILPLIGCCVIGLLDYCDLEIDDNLSFNFSLSSILFLFYLLIP
jgi:CDP-diglyceride synthetase